MEIKLNDYHKKVNAEMRAKVAYWQEHPQSRKESLRRLRILREHGLQICPIGKTPTMG